MCTLALATVTVTGEPRISGADGHLLHGRWIFGTDRQAVKARHLGARPGVSAAYMRGEELGVFAHGQVVTLNPADGAADPQWPAVLDYMTGHHGQSPLAWGDVVYYRLEPHWMVAFASDPAKLLSRPKSQRLDRPPHDRGRFAIR